MLEAGARFEDGDFPATSFDAKRFLFAPTLGMYGIQRIDMVKDCLILAGAGVGGGSLVYANTLYEPLDAFYRDPSWAHITDWKSELAPYYDQAKRMLGVVENPLHTPADEVMKQVAEDMGVGHTFHPTPVGVFFGGPDAQGGEEVADPYFGGAGPARNACLNCGECMTGCRHNAKNTLVKNYLHLAEQAGAVVHPLTTVTARPAPRRRRLRGDDALDQGQAVAAAAATKTFTADQVVFSAAALGTQKLLHQLKDEGDLPGISDRLGVLTRTNSEAILGALAPDASIDYTRGVAITSSWHPDEVTHIEPCRYGKGSNAMALMQTVLADDTPGTSRVRTWARELWAQRRTAFDLYDFRHWSERTVIALVMQTLDNSITTKWVKGRFGWRMTSEQGHGLPNPTYIPIAYEATRRIADVLGGTAGGNVGEVFNRPLTAHFIGGCTIGDSATTGVVDPWQRLFGHEGLHVVDGSAVSANLGVNPSLTITAQAERAMAFWPNKGEADPRPGARRDLPPARPGRAEEPGRARGRTGGAAAARSSASADAVRFTSAGARNQPSQRSLPL